MNREYKDISLFINALNSCNIPYLVLRNYENMHAPEIFMDGHEDLDLLSTDSRRLADAVGAVAYTDKVKEVCNDGTHYYVIIGGKQVSLDIRHVGDGYYCTEWERDMLERRIVKNGIYVMDERDYLYSYIHHTILQKRTFSAEAQGRLRDMCIRLGMEPVHTPAAYIGMLEHYMRLHNYVYVYPSDTFVPLNTAYIDKKMLQKDCSLAFRHWKFDAKVKLIEWLVDVKHKIYR